MPLVLLITASTTASPPLTLGRKSQTSVTKGRKQSKSHASFEAGRGKPWPVNYSFLEKEERVFFLPVRKGESPVRPLWAVPGFYLP
jgi:hypothetical protein